MADIKIEDQVSSLELLLKRFDAATLSAAMKCSAQQAAALRERWASALATLRWCRDNRAVITAARQRVGK